MWACFGIRSQQWVLGSKISENIVAGVYGGRRNAASILRRKAVVAC